MPRTWSDISLPNKIANGKKSRSVERRTPGPAGNATAAPKGALPGTDSSPTTTTQYDQGGTRALYSTTPSKGPLRTRGQQPRTPLAVRDSNTQFAADTEGALGTGRKRSASLVTKVPRSSHIERSASPFRAPGSFTPTASPAETATTTTTTLGSGRHQLRSNGSAKKNRAHVDAPKSRERRRKMSTPARRPNLTPQQEKEEMAAFARTPKIARTPPGGSSSSRAGLGSVLAEEIPPAQAANNCIPQTRPLAEQEHTVALATCFQDCNDNSSAVAGVPTLEEGMVTTAIAVDARNNAPTKTNDDKSQPPSGTFSSKTPQKGLKESSSATATCTVASTSATSGYECCKSNNLRLQQTTPTTAVSLGQPLVPNVTLDNEPVVAIFGRSNKLPRTPPRTAERRQITTAAAGSQLEGACEAGAGRQGDVLAADVTEAQQEKVSLGSACRVGIESSTASSATPTYQASSFASGQAAVALETGCATRSISGVGASAPVPQRREQAPICPQSRGRVSAPVGMPAPPRRVSEDVFSRPFGGRYISPVPRSIDVVTGNLRKMEESGGRGGGKSIGAEDGVDMAGFEGTLTPAAFKGLASGMRTPSTEMRRSLGGVADMVRPMMSLDPSTSQQPPGINCPSPAIALHGVRPHGGVQKRNNGGTIPPGRFWTSSSSAAAAAAAAAAATAAAAAKKSAAQESCCRAAEESFRSAAEGTSRHIAEGLPRRAAEESYRLAAEESSSCAAEESSRRAAEESARRTTEGSSQRPAGDTVPVATTTAHPECGREEPAENFLTVVSSVATVSVLPQPANSAPEESATAVVGMTQESSEERESMVPVTKPSYVAAVADADAGGDIFGEQVAITAQLVEQRDGEDDGTDVTAGDRPVQEVKTTMSATTPTETAEAVTIDALPVETHDSLAKLVAKKTEADEPPVDPFVSSTKVARTPPTAKTVTNAAPVAPVTAAGMRTETKAVTLSPPPECCRQGEEKKTYPETGGASLTSPLVRCDDNDGSATPESALVCQGTPEAGRADPFACRNKLSRTPVDQSTSGGESRNGDQSTTVEEGSGRAAECLVDEAENLRAAQLQIGELHREVAGMADRLAKQSDERSRLAEVAFGAQDEVASLRQKLDQIQQQNSNEQEAKELVVDVDTTDGDGAECTHATVNSKHAFFKEGGRGQSIPVVAAVSGSVAATRVLELEIEKWEAEQDKMEAEKEAKKARCQLEQMEIKLRELSGRDEVRQEEWLEEQLRRAQAQCAEDEKRINERQIKIKLLAADTKAQALRTRLLEEEEERAEQSVRAAASALASRAASLLEESVARNKRMARRVAGMRAGVEECEERVTLLTERSSRLESAGRAAKSEAKVVMKELEDAREALAAARAGAEALSSRLGPLERECREAQKAQEDLRTIVESEEARRVSVERCLSEVKRSGKTVLGFERARRESTERRLGVAERTRDELASAAAAAAAPALRAAIEVERERRLSVERRLEAAERAREQQSAVAAAAATASAANAATAAAEAERERRLSVERRLDAAEHARVELTAATTAATNASAASTAAVPALRAVAEAERERRLSLERRLEVAERARVELEATAAAVAVAMAAATAQKENMSKEKPVRGTAAKRKKSTVRKKAAGVRTTVEDDRAEGHDVAVAAPSIVSSTAKRLSKRIRGETEPASSGDDEPPPAKVMGGPGGVKRSVAKKKSGITPTAFVGAGPTGAVRKANEEKPVARAKQSKENAREVMSDPNNTDEEETVVSPSSRRADGARRFTGIAKKHPAVSTKPAAAPKPAVEVSSSGPAARPRRSSNSVVNYAEAYSSSSGSEDYATTNKGLSIAVRPKKNNTVDCEGKDDSVTLGNVQTKTGKDRGNRQPAEGAMRRARRSSVRFQPALSPPRETTPVQPQPSSHDEADDHVIPDACKEKPCASAGGTDGETSTAPTAPSRARDNRTVAKDGATADMLTSEKTQPTTDESRKSTTNKRGTDNIKGSNGSQAGAAAVPDEARGEKHGVTNKPKTRKVTPADMDEVEKDGNGIGKARKKRNARMSHGEGGDMSGARDSGVEESKGEVATAIAEAAEAKDTVAAVTAAAAASSNGKPDDGRSDKAKAPGRKSLIRAAKAVQQNAVVNAPQWSSPGKARRSKAPSIGTTSPKPPPQKKSRKLLGAGAARCRTPKVKVKSATVSSRRTVAVPTAGAAPVTGTVPIGTTIAAAAEPTATPEPVVDMGAADLRAATGGVTADGHGGGGAGGVNKKPGDSMNASCSTVQAAKMVGIPAVPCGAGARGRGGDEGGGKPVVKTQKSMATSALGLRTTKNKPGMMRGSFFQGFLDPKNGFKVPKLKPAATRP